MVTLVKSGIVWQFAGGFLLGAVGLVVLHPNEASADPAPIARHQTR